VFYYISVDDFKRKTTQVVSDENEKQLQIKESSTPLASTINTTKLLSTLRKSLSRKRKLVAERKEIEEKLTSLLPQASRDFLASTNPQDIQWRKHYFELEGK